MTTFFFTIGWVAIIIGLSMIYRPLGIIVAGVLLVAMALVNDKREEKDAQRTR